MAKKSRTTIVRKHPSGAMAVQVNTKDGSLVALGDLRVLITKEADAWIAQGLEIDYAIDGESFADAKQRFERGLSKTIEAHLRVYRNIDHLLQIAPKPTWDDFYAAKNTLRRFVHSQVLVQQHQQHLPFGDVVFYENIA